ncbi:TlpA family protein disulfide reductase [Halalkalibacterium halodurans]|uniref:TlpA disulfide reductase family protein n=1 Tax=Halalkalibacterium halodurans TaxID=86665 RepID=UPI0010681996|nr:TlpA disulfide reductase family protein [Halalkalibacterium halodurans]TES52821.1 TlpA family protein disulfide reductase [Halalkalibacterium halodurans]
MNKKRLTTIVVLIAVVASVIIILTQNNLEVGNGKGMLAEDFTLPLYEESQSRSLSDYRGDVVILNVWASWCEPCRKEMPALMELQSDYESEDVSIVTVNMQTFERTVNDAGEFIEELGITLPVFLDEEGEFADAYQVQHLPMTYVLDREGIIHEVILGEVTYEQLEQLIVPLLEKAS